MARKDLISARRRVHDDAEDDVESIDDGEDSQSQTSSITAAYISDGTNRSKAHDMPKDGEPQAESGLQKIVNGTAKKRQRRRKKALDGTDVKTVTVGPLAAQPSFHETNDMAAMKNGISQIGKENDNDREAEAVYFDDFAKPEGEAPVINEAEGAVFNNGMQPATSQRGPRPVQQEGSTSRDSGAPVVPTRGGFFMHDQRSMNPNDGHNQYGNRRGLGRRQGVPDFGQNSKRSGPLSNDTTAERWHHDLHDSIVKPANAPAVDYSPHVQPRPRNNAHRNTVPPSLNKSIAIANVTIRIVLPNHLVAPKFLEKVTLKQHTRLPDLRPPLRRDKPVRIALPFLAPKYVFPSAERSFIFIPRAQRPNHPSNRQRGGRIAFSGTGSRRGSVYAESFRGVSRRSSIVGRDAIVSPALSNNSQSAAGVAPSKPIVRLPIRDHAQSFEHAGRPQGYTYDLPSQPTYRHHRPSHIPMHQPRPQKAVSIATIESPQVAAIHGPQQQEQQPFHQQPFNQQFPQLSNGSLAHDMAIPSSLSRQHSHPSQVVSGTPLSNIPEGAINAQPFLPAYGSQAGFYAPQYTIPPAYYYYPPAGPEAGSAQAEQYGTEVAAAAASPHAYISQPTPYFMPVMLPTANVADDTSAVGPPHNTFAHESNGMVYYNYDAPQLSEGMDSGLPTTVPGYTMPGPGNIMTPAPDYYYPQAPSETVYYPSH